MMCSSLTGLAGWFGQTSWVGKGSIRTVLYVRHKIKSFAAGQLTVLY